MYWSNYHTHTIYSDGKNSPETYAESAIQRGFHSLGFSCHAPVPFPSSWNMKEENLTEYLKHINLLKHIYKESIPIYVGLEIDYINSITGPSKFKELGLDYNIGGVHYLGTFENGDIWDFDNSKEKFERGLKEIFGSDERKLVRSYFGQINEMILTDPPDIIAHIDLIKKYNKNNCFFEIDSKWYLDIVTETLELVAKTGCIIEVNSSCKTRKFLDSFYPELNIIRYCKKLHIPLTISSDAHSVEFLESHFTEVAEQIKLAGYNEIMVLTEGKWNPAGFTSDGIIKKSKKNI